MDRRSFLSKLTAAGAALGLVSNDALKGVVIDKDEHLMVQEAMEDYKSMVTMYPHVRSICTAKSPFQMTLQGSVDGETWVNIVSLSELWPTI